MKRFSFTPPDQQANRKGSSTRRSLVDNIRIEVEKFRFPQPVPPPAAFSINHVAAEGVGVCLGPVRRLPGLHGQVDPVETIRMVTKEKLTCLAQLPTMFLIEMQLPLFRETDWSNVEVFAWAGLKAFNVMVSAPYEIARKTGALLVTGYGSTEVCGFVTYTEREDADSLDVLVQTAGKAR